MKVMNTASAAPVMMSHFFRRRVMAELLGKPSNPYHRRYTAASKPIIR
jgi:hypothetical protein